MTFREAIRQLIEAMSAEESAEAFQIVKKRLAKWRLIGIFALTALIFADVVLLLLIS